MSDLAATIAGEVVPRPRPQRLLHVGEALATEGESVLSTRHGVVWIAANDGNVAFLDAAEPSPGELGHIPVTALWFVM